ncbi:MAG TPA: lamin tail domain-containing protein [Candidatus Polarisedimenticolia bacterium]|nr:lamin tail domain-containing protein [Candidatus Polarisedimenticolia bacterium]
MKKTLLFIAALVTALGAQAQLAITEVMSGESDKNHPDWFELHNYGANDIDLTGYSWNDDAHGGFSGADSAPFNGVTIHSGESIAVMEQKGVTDAAGFRTWWGLAASFQVVVLNAADPGLSASPLVPGFNRADSVRLWRTNLAALGSNTNGLDLDECPEYLVARADLGVTVASSLLFDPISGAFDILSTNAVNGAFASDNGEVASPGIAPGALPVTMHQLPAGQTATVGDTVMFTNGGTALPPLQFQWFFNGTPINSQTPNVSVRHHTAGIDNAVSNDISILVLSDIQRTNAGTYQAIASNGLQSFTNSAILTVNASPTPPSIVSYTPALTQGFDAYLGQAVNFSVTASGFPAPAYQWSRNNAPVADQTNADFTLGLSDTNQTGVYSVEVTNSAGGTNLSFTINVTPKPNLVITEVMSGESANTNNGDVSGHNDWFELSNLGGFPVNLYGCRIDDSHNSLSAAHIVNSQVIIHPSESVVFVQNMTPDQFRAWWGTSLASSVQIIDYDGSGQGLSGSGDEVHLWNAVAQDADQIASVAFGPGTNGISFGFTLDPNFLDQSGFDGFTLTTNGMNGAFVAAVGGDIGSPGALINMPRITSFAPVPGGLSFSWFSQPNWHYTIQYKTNLLDSSWTTLNQVVSGDTNSMSYTDSAANAQRFYRVFLNFQNQ